VLDYILCSKCSRVATDKIGFQPIVLDLI
jgi:hypothetical protein